MCPASGSQSEKLSEARREAEWQSEQVSERLTRHEARVRDDRGAHMMPDARVMEKSVREREREELLSAD